MLLFLFSLFISTFLPLFSLENLERPLTTQAEYVAALDELQSFRRSHDRGRGVLVKVGNFWAPAPRFNELLMREWGIDGDGRYLRPGKITSFFEEHPGIARLFATYDQEAARHLAELARGERSRGSYGRIKNFLAEYPQYNAHSGGSALLSGKSSITVGQMRSDTTAQSIIFGKTVGGLLLRALIVLSIANWLKSRDKSIPALMFKKVQSYISSVRAYFKEKYRNPSSMVKEVSASVWKAAKKYKWITIPLVIWFMLQAVQLVQHGTLSPYNKSAENDNSLLGVPHLRDVANAPYTLAEGVERGLSYPLFYDPDASLKWNALQQGRPEALDELSAIKTGKALDWLVGYKDPVSEEVGFPENADDAAKTIQLAFHQKSLEPIVKEALDHGAEKEDLLSASPFEYSSGPQGLCDDLNSFIREQKVAFDTIIDTGFFNTKDFGELSRDLRSYSDEQFRRKYAQYYLKRAKVQEAINRLQKTREALLDNSFTGGNVRGFLEEKYKKILDDWAKKFAEKRFDRSFSRSSSDLIDNLQKLADPEKPVDIRDEARVREALDDLREKWGKSLRGCIKHSIDIARSDISQIDSPKSLTPQRRDRARFVKQKGPDLFREEVLSQEEPVFRDRFSQVYEYLDRLGEERERLNRVSDEFNEKASFSREELGIRARKFLDQLLDKKLDKWADDLTRREMASFQEDHDFSVIGGDLDLRSERDLRMRRRSLYSRWDRYFKREFEDEVAYLGRDIKSLPVKHRGIAMALKGKGRGSLWGAAYPKAMDLFNQEVRAIDERLARLAEKRRQMDAQVSEFSERAPRAKETLNRFAQKRRADKWREKARPWIDELLGRHFDRNFSRAKQRELDWLRQRAASGELDPSSVQPVRRRLAALEVEWQAIFGEAIGDQIESLSPYRLGAERDAAQVARKAGREFIKEQARKRMPEVLREKLPDIYAYIDRVNAEGERLDEAMRHFNEAAPRGRGALRESVRLRRERRREAVEQQHTDFEGRSDFRDHILGVQKRATGEVERLNKKIKEISADVNGRLARHVNRDLNEKRREEFEKRRDAFNKKYGGRALTPSESLSASFERGMIMTDFDAFEVPRLQEEILRRLKPEYQREFDRAVEPYAIPRELMVGGQQRRLLHDLEEYGLPAHRFECCSASDSLDDRVLCASCYKSTITEKPHCPFCRVLLTPELVHGFTPHRHKQEQCAICGDHIVAPRRSADAVDTEEVDDLEEGEGIPIPEPEVDVDEMD